MKKTVYVGMSGGVDSSLTAALLKEQGYDVTGVYMKNWTRDIAGWPCPWRDDFRDAKRVAIQLGIPLKVFDFQKQYKSKVVDYMIAEYKAGRTPNPDIMCNQEIKFKLFLNTSLEEGADLIATGHYAQVQNGQLKTAKDKNKDQTYFLYRISRDALQRTLFPLGEFKSKNDVRTEAQKRGLLTANKPDSQGICFVGEVGIEDFIQEFVDVKPGPIIDQHGKELGQHRGAVFYTIGQRHGLNIGGGLPYYVTNTDINKNIVFVTNDINSRDLWSDSINLINLHWINRPPQTDKDYLVRTRHRGELIGCRVGIKAGRAKLSLNSQLRAITPGQSAVIYDKDLVLGGGVVTGS